MAQHVRHCSCSNQPLPRWRSHTLPSGLRLPTLQRARLATRAAAKKDLDVIGLSNLCVDVVVPVRELPPPDTASREALLEELTSTSFSLDTWEVGGMTNFAIAAARLGLRTGTVGHLGSDSYGDYMEKVLRGERVNSILRIEPPEEAHGILDRTLVCFVLVDPAGGHTFCSRYDFGPWPLLEGVDHLPTHVIQALTRTRAVCLNGYVFDELPLALVKAAAEVASGSGAAIFFDPGPRCFTMKEGARLEALETMMSLSDTVLMTLEEAVEVTGHSDPLVAAKAVLARPGAKTRWAVVKEGGDGALVAERQRDGSVASYQCPAMKVDVVDTVGCGDSFAAAIVAGFINGHDIPGTLLLANAVGAATATGRGAGTNVADVNTVRRLLRQAAGGGRHGAAAVQSAERLLDLALQGGAAAGSVDGNGNGNGAAGSGGGNGAGKARGESGDRAKAAQAA